jgi:hypothetical protein
LDVARLQYCKRATANRLAFVNVIKISLFPTEFREFENSCSLGCKAVSIYKQPQRFVTFAASVSKSLEVFFEPEDLNLQHESSEIIAFYVGEFLIS